MQLHFSSIGNNIVASISLDEMSARDRIMLLHKLLCDFEYKPDGEGAVANGYEAYQEAAEIILRGANRFWDSDGDARLAANIKRD